MSKYDWTDKIKKEENFRLDNLIINDDMTNHEKLKNWVMTLKKVAENKIENPFAVYPDAENHSIEMFTVCELAKIEIHRGVLLMVSVEETVKMLEKYFKQTFQYHYIDQFGTLHTKIQQENHNYVMLNIEGYKLSEAKKIYAYAETLWREEQPKPNEHDNQKELGL